MKKLFYFLLSLVLTSSAFAVTSSYFGVNQSSNTASVETTVRIENSNRGDIIHSVIVGDCGTGPSLFTLYDSSAQASNTLFVADASTTPVGGSITGGGDCRNQYILGILISSGITYSKTGTSNITILWSDENVGDD